MSQWLGRPRRPPDCRRLKDGSSSSSAPQMDGGYHGNSPTAALRFVLFVYADGGQNQNHERANVGHVHRLRRPGTGSRGGKTLCVDLAETRPAVDWCDCPPQMVRDKDKAERKRKAEMARLRREKIMAQMSEMQKHFINENKELFQQSLEELEASTSAAAADNRYRQVDSCWSWCRRTAVSA